MGERTGDNYLERETEMRKNRVIEGETWKRRGRGRESERERESKYN